MLAESSDNSSARTALLHFKLISSGFPQSFQRNLWCQTFNNSISKCSLKYFQNFHQWQSETSQSLVTFKGLGWESFWRRFLQIQMKSLLRESLVDVLATIQFRTTTKKRASNRTQAWTPIKNSIRPNNDNNCVLQLILIEYYISEQNSCVRGDRRQSKWLKYVMAYITIVNCIARKYDCMWQPMRMYRCHREWLTTYRTGPALHKALTKKSDIIN